MISPGEAVLVALSAGPDSTALLHALVQLSRRFRCQLRACHVNHGLRGAESDADARHAASQARALGVPLTRRTADVRAYAQSRRVSIEAAARAVRYELLEWAAGRYRMSRIATGHTQTDQAETVLLNLVRGSGPRGLAGIPPVRGKIIRPLLGVTREEAARYCEMNDLSYRTDSSNLDTSIPRNRIRHEVMPQLAQIQGQVVSGLARLADIMRAEDEYLSAQAEHSLREIAAQRPGEVGVSCGLLANLPAALQRRVVRAAIARVKGSELDVPLERVDSLLELAASGRTGAVIELPGALRAERTYAELVISFAPPPRAAPKGAWTLPVPGELTISELDLEISARRSRAKRPPANPMSALLDASKLESALTVRSRRRGDRFTPFGMKGTVKLQDFFVNAKVPRSERARVPLVLAGDEIVWVVGYRISEHYKVTDETRRSVRLDARRLT